jgi:chromosome segregation ATPase
MFDVEGFIENIKPALQRRALDLPGSVYNCPPDYTHRDVLELVKALEEARGELAAARDESKRLAAAEADLEDVRAELQKVTGALAAAQGAVRVLDAKLESQDAKCERLKEIARLAKENLDFYRRGMRITELDLSKGGRS